MGKTTQSTNTGIIKLLDLVENYTKGEVRDVEDHPNLKTSDSAVHMKVNYGSKIRNLMGYAIKKMKDPQVRELTWNGSGTAATKVVSCAEIMKRKIKGLHQLTDIRFKRTEEYWEPKLEGLERLKVNRDIPAVTILLSKDPLDSSLSGYQPPGSLESFWKMGVERDQKSRNDRKNKKKAPGSQGGETTGNFSVPKKKKKKKAGSREVQTARDSEDSKMETNSPASDTGADQGHKESGKLLSKRQTTEDFTLKVPKILKGHSSF